MLCTTLYYLGRAWTGPCISCRGLETKLQQCLIGSDIFADQAPGADSRLQFSGSPNGKIREVSDAKKRALQVMVEHATA